MLKTRKTKIEKGITLIALIITIVVLLILAAVAIASITNDGVLSYAENATTQYNQAVKNEQDTLQGYVDYLNKHNGGSGNGNGSDTGGTKTVAEVKNTIQTSNTKVVDEYGNQIVVPAGFKIRVDEGTERTKGSATSFATHVTEGIVIEDASENQFVWVPVGTIYTNAEQTESKTITLGRYAYDTDVGTNDYIPENGEYTPGENITAWGNQCTEDTVENHESDYENAIARNIEDFKTSANQNKGYYIGRFEAGNSSDSLVCKTGQTVYANITQPNASTACKNMYNEGADGYNANTFSSDLINSYAWDTAIIFIQTFGGESEYYKQNKSTSFTTTGGNQDEYCNINDMSGNAKEFSTETCNGGNGPCVDRGGYYGTGTYNGYPYGYTSPRSSYEAYCAFSNLSFRPLLYVAL